MEQISNLKKSPILINLKNDLNFKSEEKGGEIFGEKILNEKPDASLLIDL